MTPTSSIRQRIRFCPTPAGKVAYSVIGQGPFLICDTGWVSHLEKMLEIEWSRSFFAALAERFAVVRYDKAGCGLSDRTGVDLTFEAQVRTAAAIADELKASRFHLFGASQGGQDCGRARGQGTGTRRTNLPLRDLRTGRRACAGSGPRLAALACARSLGTRFAGARKRLHAGRLGAG